MPLLLLPPSTKEFAQKREYKNDRSRRVANLIVSVTSANMGFW